MTRGKLQTRPQARAHRCLGVVEAGEEEELPDQRVVVAYQAAATVACRVHLEAEEEAFLAAYLEAEEEAFLEAAYWVVVGVAYLVACREGAVAYRCQEDNALEAVEGVVVLGVAVWQLGLVAEVTWGQVVEPR